MPGHDGTGAPQHPSYSFPHSQAQKVSITPAPKSFAPELLLLAGNTKLERKYHGKDIKDFSQELTVNSCSYCPPKTGSVKW